MYKTFIPSKLQLQINTVTVYKYAITRSQVPQLCQNSETTVDLIPQGKIDLYHVTDHLLLLSDSDEFKGSKQTRIKKRKYSVKELQ
jgi:hypothetical protein